MLLLVFSLACDVPPTCLLLGGGTGLDDTTLAALELQCTESETEACDPDTFLGVDAAECLAERSGLSEGLAPWTSELRTNAQLHRVEWRVENIETWSEADIGGSGKTFDAITGEPTGDFDWFGETP